MEVLRPLQHVLDAVIERGGTPYVVGGSVRDMQMGVEPKDVDIEVFGLDFHTLENILNRYGNASLVGESFGVLKFRMDKEQYDFSLPRRDNKIGAGHKGFEITVDPTMTVAEAAARRDFTINSIMFDLKNKQIVDPYDGMSDLRRGILRHTDAKSFAEDPLRVLRGMQFCARFDLTAWPATLELCRSLKEEFGSLPKERLWAEWEKWATKAKMPSRGLAFLRDCGWIDCFPMIAALESTPQDAEWHPEGNVFIHTALVCDAMSEICVRENIKGEEKTILMMAALTHDFAKPKTTVIKDGRIRSPGHEEAGGPMAEEFLNDIGCFPRITEVVIPLVVNHLIHVRNQMWMDSPIRKLSIRLKKANIEQLAHMVEADMGGRPPLPKGQHQSMAVTLKRARELGVNLEAPKPIIMGRHLIDLGLSPSKAFGDLLKACFKRQVEGKFETEAEGIEVAKQLVAVEHRIINGQHLLDIGLSPGPKFGIILKRCHDAQVAGEFKDEAGAKQWLEAIAGEYRDS